MHNNRAHFEAMFTESDDPWQFKSRWYESRKRALTLACLQRRRYASAYEPGCANGELSAALAPRCDRLLVTDGSEKAVALARTRLADQAHVQVRQAWLPGEWPCEVFDLVVISEWGFYLGAEDLDALAAKTLASLGPGGTVLACHWRRPIAGCLFDGDQVHRRLAEQLALPVLGHVVDADMRIDVWCRDGLSVAQREGFADGDNIRIACERVMVADDCCLCLPPIRVKAA